MMKQGKIENPLVNNRFQKQSVSSIRPWQRRTIIAPFGISELKIDRAKVRPGDNVTISFKAMNTGDFTSIYPVTLKINGEVVAAEVVSLPHRTVMPMKFTVAKTLPGNYGVDINNSIATFTVVGNVLENEMARLEGFSPDISNMEASFDFSLPEPQMPAKQSELSVKNVVADPIKLQSGINRMASCIEFGLDKIGDILTFPLEKLVDLTTTIFNYLKKK